MRLQNYAARPNSVFLANGKTSPSDENLKGDASDPKLSSFATIMSGVTLVSTVGSKKP